MGSSTSSFSRMTLRAGVLALALACGASAEMAAQGVSVARGRYLAEGVCECFECHSPMEDNDLVQPIASKLGAGDILNKKSATSRPTSRRIPRRGLDAGRTPS